ncbi:MAG: universal stress protein [Pseudomonadales bacterium]
MFKKVMVVIDSKSDHQFALDKALQLARSDDFELQLFSCEQDQHLIEGYYFEAGDIEKIQAAAIKDRIEALEQIAQPLRDNGLNVTTAATWSYPNYQGVIDQVESEQVDLVIYHLQPRDTLSKLMLTFDDWQLIRLCPVPLLLAKDTPWKRSPTLLAAVDPQHARHKPSGLDHKILDMCEHLGELIGGEVYAVHSYHPIALSGVFPGDVKRQHQQAFAELMKDFSVPEERQLLIEDLAPFALRDAEQKIDADIVAMGAISRSLLSDVFIGSTTQEVMDFLSCDVLVLKPADF